jgi:hypothetical protein
MPGPRSERKPKPKLPNGLRIYAVSDVNGCADLLRTVFAAIDHHLARAEPARSLHVFLGDYIDRGPASRETIDLLIERSRRHESIFLKGNHEAFLFEVLQDSGRLDAWTDYGGFQTLMSYGLAPSLKPDRDEQNELMRALRAVMPDHHRRFFSSLRSSFSCGDFLFRARRRQARRAVTATVGRRPALDQGRIPSERAGFQQIRRARPHAPSPSPTSVQTGSILTPAPMRPAF